MDTDQFLDIFLEETAEHLDSLNNCLLQLEKRPENKDVLDEIFRVSHTLKGMAGTMGFTGIARLTHEMESLLDEIRKKRIKVNTELMDTLFKCLDELQTYTVSITTEGTEHNGQNLELIKKLWSLQGKKGAVKGYGDERNKQQDNIQQNLELNDHEILALGEARRQGLNCFVIKLVLDKDCMLKSARAFVVFNTLEKKGDIIKSIPEVEDIEDEKFDRTIELVLITANSIDEIKAALISVSEIEDIKVQRVYIPGRTDDFHVAKDEEEGHTKGVEAKEQRKKSVTGKTVRVDIQRLDNLMNLVSELIIIKTRLEESRVGRNGEGTEDTLEYLERITTNLHDAVMKVRMVPIERVFNRFPRMVRDLSKGLGKETKLFMYGEETEVDRTVIDEIGDPLIHFIRNSIDHGIESIEERKASGKAPEGRITLKAFHDGNTVVIEVEDDGRGIDIRKVERRAVESGLYSQQRIETLNEEDLTRLIFAPGFSTAMEVSDLSGRGVGLDVVKTKIESLGGVVELENRPGLGSKFIVRLPLTLAIIQALLVNVGKESYAIPLSSIKEIVTMDRASIKNIQNTEMVLLRGKTLPIIRLARELGLEDHRETGEEMTIVVVKKGEKLAGMIVDRLIGQQEIVIKSLGKFLSGIRYIAGATILGNGGVSLILDINPFI